jgi:hypothetical protein
MEAEVLRLLIKRLTAESEVIRAAYARERHNSALRSAEALILALLELLSEEYKLLTRS